MTKFFKIRANSGQRRRAKFLLELVQSDSRVEMLFEEYFAKKLLRESQTCIWFRKGKLKVEVDLFVGDEPVALKVIAFERWLLDSNFISWAEEKNEDFARAEMVRVLERALVRFRK